MHERKKITKSALSAIIISALLLSISVILLIVNCFFPVRFLTAYATGATPKKTGTARVTFIDVGLGDSVLVEFPDGKVMLIDGGYGTYSEELNLLKVLNGNGIESIDYLVCTSVKEEHCGGLTEVIKSKKVKKAYIPYCLNTRINDSYHAFISALKESGVEQVIANVGEGAYGNGYFFSFLSPSSYQSTESEYTKLNQEPNKENIENASAVLWLECLGTSFAFTSDVRATALEGVIEKYELSKLLGNPYCPQGDYGVVLEDCDFTTIACHGAEKNAYVPWYATTTPQVAVVSVAERQTGYPTATALSNAIGVGAQIYMTMNSGNITVEIDTNGYTVHEEKK